MKRPIKRLRLNYVYRDDETDYFNKYHSGTGLISEAESERRVHELVERWDREAKALRLLRRHRLRM